MKVPVWIVPVLVLVFLFGSVAVGKATGVWQTSGSDLRTLEGALPEDIRGSSTLQAASEAWGIPMADLVSLLGIPADTPAETPFKDLEAYVEVSVARDLISRYLGLGPVEGEDESEAESVLTPAEPEAEATLTSEPVVTETAVAEPEAEDAETAETTEQEAAAGTTPEHEPSPISEEEISGRSSLRQVSESSGMPLEDLYAALNLPADLSPESLLKDLRESIEGFEIEAVRTAVEEYLAAQ